MACKMAEANRNAPPQRVHRHVVDRVVAYLTVPQQACARRASKALWEAVRAESMENLLRATVLEHRDTSNVGAQLVFVAMSGGVAPFPSGDAMVEWCGGLTLLYEELQQRFPRAAAIGVSARLAAIRPFPFASGSTVTAMCILSAHALDSVVLEVRNPSILVRALSHDGAACPILCLEGVTPEEFPQMLDGVPLSSLPPIRCIAPSAMCEKDSLRSVCLANLPLLENIGDYAFCRCGYVLSVDLFALPSLRSIGKRAFKCCFFVRSLTLANLPLLEDIGELAFAECLHLTRVDLSGLASLRTLREDAFRCSWLLQSFSLVDLQLLERIDNKFLAECEHLTSVELSQLPSLRSIGQEAFYGCKSLQSVTLANLPVLESIQEGAFCECVRLTRMDFTNVNLSGLQALHKTRAGALSRMLVTPTR